MGVESRVVSWTKGEKVVVVEGGSVRVVAAQAGEVSRTVDGGERALLFSGTPEEAARVVDAFAADPAPSFDRKGLAVASVAVLVVALAGSWGISAFHRSPAPRYANAAPASLASNNPDEGDDAFYKAGNDNKPGSVSPNGATGASLQPALGRPGGASPAGSPPRAVALPQATKEALDPAGAKAVPPAPSDQVRQPPREPGIASRALEAEERSKAAGAKAKEDVAKDGPEETKRQVEDLRRAMEQIGDDRKVPADFARKLPSDVAKKLADAGAIESPEETAERLSGKPHKELAMVRLPARVTDRLRDADGIPTVPEESTWTATGGNVVVPLPGGGEIRRPADLEAFHLQP